MKDLELVDLNNVYQTKKVLGKIDSQMIFFAKIKEASGLVMISRLVDKFLSTNRSRLYKEAKFQPVLAYRTKRFVLELESFIRRGKDGY